MEILQSRLLAAFPHGFTTRRGGASAPPYDELNLGDRVEDDPAAVAENWRRLQAACGLGFARVRQVHGAEVLAADAPCLPEVEADAVVSHRPGVAACVAVADCVPVLLADPATGLVAAVHAGWRGTLARAAAAGVEALRRAGAGAPAGLLAAIGPSIGPCCYLVSPELAATFEAAFGAGVVRRGDGGPRLDLWTANQRALQEVGVAHLDRLERCTACERDRFFSHRRDGGRTGRMVGFIAPLSISPDRAVP